MLQRFRKIVLLVIILSLLGGGFVWWQRDDLLGYYYFQQLSQADGTDRELWLNRLIGLDESIIPRALDCFRQSAKRSCSDGEDILIGLAKKWKDERSAKILEQMLPSWGTFSEPGMTSALVVASVVLEQNADQNSLRLQSALARELLESAQKEAFCEHGMLQLAVVLARLGPSEMPRELFVTLAERGLSSTDRELRALALRLFLLPPFNRDAELLTKAVPYMQDAAAEVRRVAVLVVGSNQDIVTDDDLLPLLHDADLEVRGYCEVALRSRGLQDQHIIVARLISDENPSARLEVLPFLHNARDLDPIVWLRRLCQDPSSAVRAAAIRAVASQDLPDLHDRLREMSQRDVSPTVRQLAGHYLRQAAYSERTESPE